MNMVEGFDELVRTRRSIRRYEGKPVRRAELEKLAELGAWAPSGGNAQSWHFVIIQDAKRLEAIHSLSPGMLAPPPAVIAICQDLDRAYQVGGSLGREFCSVMDSAMAAQNILLGAHARGLGTCPILSFHKAGVARLLNLPESVVCQLLITVGWPAEAPGPPAREIERVIHSDVY